MMLRRHERAGCRARVGSSAADEREELKAALAQGPWDLVISDYVLPHFSAPGALALVQASELDLPFVVVSGAIGEETAVQAMRAGACDYIMKGNLTRLAPAIVRELRKAGARCERKQFLQDRQLGDRGAPHGLIVPLAVSREDYPAINAS